MFTVGEALAGSPLPSPLAGLHLRTPSFKHPHLLQVGSAVAMFMLKKSRPVPVLSSGSYSRVTSTGVWGIPQNIEPHTLDGLWLVHFRTGDPIRRMQMLLVHGRGQWRKGLGGLLCVGADHRNASKICSWLARPRAWNCAEHCTESSSLNSQQPWEVSPVLIAILQMSKPRKR